MARTKIVPTEGLLSDLEYTSVIVSYSNGIDSTGALYWAVKNFPKEKRRWQQARRQQERERQARRWYFLKQRALGAAVLVFTVLAVWILEGDATIALITVPLGLALIFSRQKLVVNDYYFETEVRRQKWE